MNDVATVVEDDPATAIDVRTNDTDADGGLMAVESVTQPGDGTVNQAGGSGRIAQVNAILTSEQVLDDKDLSTRVSNDCDWS